MKNVIITGANSGLGFETAKKIANSGIEYRLILACRNVQKGEDAKKSIIAESGNENIVVMELNTASLDSVRRFAGEYEESGYGKIYALLCNAGVSGTNSGLTEDGFDVIFETNHLGHFLLTNLLLPWMEEEGLIFATSSDMHDSPMGKMEWNSTETLAHPNPGLMKTNFMPLTKASMAFVKMSMPERYGDLDKSSTAYAQLVTEDGLVKESGLYYDRSIHAKRSSALSYNIENRKELWAKSCEYCGL